MDYGGIDTLGLVFSAYLDDLGYLLTFHFVLKHFTLATFMLSILPELDYYLLLSHTSQHDTWPHTSLSIKRRCRSILYFFGCAFIHLMDFRFNIFHDSKAWQIFYLLVMMLSFWQLACWVLICLFFVFWALVIIVFIYQLVLFCQHGIMIHGPIWHYPFEVGHFHYMMDENISEYSIFEAFYISICPPLHTGVYPLLKEHQTFQQTFIHLWSSCWPLRVAYWGISSFPGIVRPFTDYYLLT